MPKLPLMLMLPFICDAFGELAFSKVYVLKLFKQFKEDRESIEKETGKNPNAILKPKPSLKPMLSLMPKLPLMLHVKLPLMWASGESDVPSATNFPMADNIEFLCKTVVHHQSEMKIIEKCD